jgi:hypothetical protein
VVTRRELPSNSNTLALLSFDLTDKLPGNIVFKTSCIRYYSHFSNPKEANDSKQKVILEDQFTMFGTAPVTVHYDFNFLSPKETEAKVSVSIRGPAWVVLLTKVACPKVGEPFPSSALFSLVLFLSLVLLTLVLLALLALLFLGFHPIPLSTL